MNCRVCDSGNLELVVDLGAHPWCNHFLRAEEVGREPRYPLRLVYCQQCHTAQLDFTVKKEIMFGDHTYLSGITASLRSHFEHVAIDVDARFCQGKARKSVLDIGSNDGTQLTHFQKLGFRVRGVESSKTTARLANEAGVPTVNAFFDLDLARSLGEKFDVINAAGVFFHLEELHSVADGIRSSLEDDGVFVVQFLYMKSIVENLAFDQIYHEHLLYYNLATIECLLERHGLELFDAEWAPIHGGSIIGFAGHRGRTERSARLQAMLAAEEAAGANRIETYHDFNVRIQQMRIANVDYLERAHAARKRVYGMGAPVKGNTLLNFFGVDQRLIQLLVERNPLRKGLYAPGSHIPVMLEDEIDTPPDIYYVLAWNFRDEILKRYASLIQAGVEFYFPVQPKAAAPA